MRRQEQRQLTKPVDVEVICDNCGKRADTIPRQYTLSGTSYDLPEGWHDFSAGHSDWGNDSIDSYDRFDVCSAACYLVILSRELADYGSEHRHPTLRIDEFDYPFLRDLVGAVEKRGTAKT